jgi:hypothetical protein
MKNEKIVSILKEEYKRITQKIERATIKVATLKKELKELEKTIVEFGGEVLDK